MVGIYKTIDMTNLNHEYSEYISRHMEEMVRLSAKLHPVVLVQGARQVGKSTMVKGLDFLGGYKFYDLDNFEHLRLAQKNPTQMWAGVTRVVIEEVQRSPALLEAIHTDGIGLKKKTRFVLTASYSTPELVQFVEEVASRGTQVQLLPCSPSEAERWAPCALLRELLDGESITRKYSTPPASLNKHVGHFPEVVGQKDEGALTQWYESYLGDFLERDLRALSGVSSLVEFRRLMASLSTSCGDVTNQTAMARQLSISQPSVYRHLAVLEASLLLYRLNAFDRPCSKRSSKRSSKGSSKRIVKTPKHFFVEPGLFAHLWRVADNESLGASSFEYRYMQCQTLLSLRAAAELMVPRGDISFWRTSTAKDVDFVLSHKSKLLAFQVDPGDGSRENLLEHLELFMSEYKETVAGIVVHNRLEVEELAPGVIGIPMWLLA